MKALFGDSWKTSVMGILQAIATGIMTYIIASVTNNEAVTWAGVSVAILQVVKGFLQKDYNVSGGAAPEPKAEERVVNDAN